MITTGKTIVMGMRERNTDKAKGRTKAMIITITTHLTLQGKIVEHIKPFTHLYTDERSGYIDIQKYFYSHQTVNHSDKKYGKGVCHTNGIESVWSVLREAYMEHSTM